MAKFTNVAYWTTVRSGLHMASTWSAHSGPSPTLTILPLTILKYPHLSNPVLRLGWPVVDNSIQRNVEQTNQSPQSTSSIFLSFQNPIYPDNLPGGLNFISIFLSLQSLFNISFTWSSFTLTLFSGFVPQLHCYLISTKL